jgi:apolipoprotein N-acyltransferase
LTRLVFLNRFPALWALLLGLLSALSFEPVGLWPLMFLAFALLCELVSRAPSLRAALFTGWAFGVGQFVVGLNWIATAFTFQAAMPAWLGWIAVVLLSLYLAVYPALAAGLAWRFGKERPLALVLALAGAWAITEWLRGTMFTGFAWNPVGVTLIDTPWRVTSAIVGTYGLSILVVLVSGGLWLLARRNWRAPFAIAATAALLLAWPLPVVPNDCCLKAFDADRSAELPRPPILTGEEEAPPPGTPAPPPPSYVQQQPGTPPPVPPAAGSQPPPPTMTAEEQRAYALNNRMFYDVRIVQPNIGQEDKWREGLVEEAYVRHGALSAGGTASPRLLLWPEVAIPEPFQILGSDQRPLPVFLPAIARVVQSLRPGDVLLTGAFALIADEQGKVVGNTNSVFAIGSDRDVRGRYDKAHLVPYGEYLPMRPLLSAIGLSQLAPGPGDTSYGPGPRTLNLGNGFGKAGIQICYEIIFSGQVVDRRNRPDFIFNPSNDAWFGRWGPPQHLAQAQLRAAEEGLPVLRSTPTGISAIIDARGQLVKSIPWQRAGVIDSVIPQAAIQPTLFARLGNVIPLLIGFALLVAAIALGTSRRYRDT